MQRKLFTNNFDFVLKFEQGEELIQTLTKFCDDNKIYAGFFYGIGALKDTELGFYDLEKKEYIKKVFNEEMELIQITGNISSVENKPFVHAHVILGRHDFSTIGGHFFKGIVSVTAEIVLKRLPEEILRQMDNTIGLKLLNLSNI